MLPSLHALDSQVLSTEAGKRARGDTDGTGAIYFKAFKKGPYRKLSNLFGPVEWAFQRQKFREGSPVYNWLLEGERKARLGRAEGGWTRAEFDAARLAMKHDGKLESYLDADGAIATGLLAQMTSLMVKNPDSTDARHRLAYILGTPGPVNKEAMSAWHTVDVNPPLGDDDKYGLMSGLVYDKFTTDDNYKQLLLSTGDRVLHEAKGRGAPGLWEYMELSEAQIAKGFSPGGDWLGKILMSVRSVIRDAPAVAPVAPAEPPTPEEPVV